MKVLKSIASHAAVFMRSCFISFHKRVYNLVSRMTIEVESAHLVVHLSQRSALYGVNLRKKLWKCSQRSLKEDNPLGGVLFLQIQSLDILYLNVPWSCRPYRYSNVIICTDSTVEHTEDEGLGANILVLRCVRWQKLELSRRTSIREKFSQVNRSASNCLTSRSSFHFSIHFNSKIVFSWLFVISLVMEAMGLPSPCFLLCTCWHCYSFPWYWPVFTNMFIRDRS